MLYTEFINRAMGLTIDEADNGLFYLEPMWRTILHDNQLYFNDVSDFEVTPEKIEDVLKLEVEKRNAINSKQPSVINWIFDIINTKADPLMQEEETKLFTQFLTNQNDDEAWNNFKKS